MSDAPVSPSGLPSDLPSGFARAWRLLLPAAIAIMLAAVGIGLFDTSSASAWIFAAGVAIGLVGLASLASRLFDLGRREVRELEKRLEDQLEKRGDGRS